MTAGIRVLTLASCSVRLDEDWRVHQVPVPVTFVGSYQILALSWLPVPPPTAGGGCYVLAGSVLHLVAQSDRPLAAFAEVVDLVSETP